MEHGTDRRIFGPTLKDPGQGLHGRREEILDGEIADRIGLIWLLWTARRDFGWRNRRSNWINLVAWTARRRGCFGWSSRRGKISRNWINLIAMDAREADLMRFGWMESAREEICHVEEMEQISQILD